MNYFELHVGRLRRRDRSPLVGPRRGLMPMAAIRRFCRACGRRMRFAINCVRMGPSSAAWVHDYEAQEDRDER